MIISTRLKLFLLLVADILMLFISQISTLLLSDQWYQNPFTPFLSCGVFVVVSWVNGFYKTSISHVGISAVKQALVSIFIAGIMIYLLNESIQLVLFSSILVFVGIIGYRVFAREFLFHQRHSSAAKTLVYGAGSAGVQFVIASMQGDAFNVVGYIDDDEMIKGSSIHGREVYQSKNVKSLVKKYDIQIIVLALPSITRLERKLIIESLISLPVRVITVPTFEDLIEGKQITQTENISVEDLLGRDPVPPLERYIKSPTEGKVCLVTGAGGSIGSELCRQIAKCKPKHLILLDMSEPALFNIEQDLLQSKFTGISCYLGSVTDNDLLNKVFTENEINSVFHAAAYKHVPMVESNPMAGLINNVEGTKNILAATQRAKCESFTLISTDKAVRPTNVMGATKRIAEMFCQFAAESNSNNTVISMVRFGNVLGSSGSVIPTFQKQIKQGGPITLTHREITRYFMTINEAAQLVIQAAGMADQGDLFLLDMGEPVRIYDLAERLIRLSGKTVKHDANGDESGAIEIKVTGLRSGEKLYEELLVDADAVATEHTKIMRAREQYISKEALEAGFEDLVDSLKEGNFNEFKAILGELVIGYKPTESK
ncbi:MAG: nucleoside-diphosphate sugar epimerase/dehydratase [Emcibacteraceae bacterium]|nr:nucleoside-diphosphate sugar epimerase/dehydratase [Emcibacteraceae bacterium]